MERSRNIWVDKSQLPVITVRYEDLSLDPDRTFFEVLDFLNWNYSKKEIRKAVNHSKISLLQEQELTAGFREKPIKADQFFRAGKIGSWKDEIGDDIVQLIYKSHKKVMDRFGYSVNYTKSY